MFGLPVLVFLFLLAFVGPYLGQWSYTDHDFNAFLQGPSLDHWFGTTQTGGDVFALTLRGMQKSLVIGILVALISTGVAALVGSFAGYFGGWIDRSLMWFVDLLLVLPSFLIIAILSPTFRGKTWLVFVVLLAAFLWMVTARIVRGMTISLREREYVLAARYMGVPGAPDHLPPHPAEHLVAADRRRDDQRERRGDLRDRAVVLRLRRPAAGRLARHADRGRHPVRDDVSVAVRLRRRDPGRARPGGQPRRRRAARRARPDARGSDRWPIPSSPCRGLTVHVPRLRRRRPGRARHRLRARSRARCSASSASPARASPRRRSPSSGCCPANADVDGSIRLDGEELHRPRRRADVEGPRQAHRDGLPGPAVGAHAGLHGRRPDRRGRPHPQRRLAAGGARAERRAARRSSASRTPPSARTPSRTSSPAACASA